MTFKIRAYYADMSEAFVKNPKYTDRQAAIKAAGKLFDTDTKLCEVEVVKTSRTASSGSVRYDEHIEYVAERSI